MTPTRWDVAKTYVPIWLTMLLDDVRDLWWRIDWTSEGAWCAIIVLIGIIVCAVITVTPH